jgi:NAD(P)H-hydrate epimerase
MKLYTAQEMTTADKTAQSLGIPGGVLMERAGAAMAAEILTRYTPRRLRRALVLCGGGNNGGDGFVIAREMHRAGVEVVIITTKYEYSGDPATNLETLRNLGVTIHNPEMLDELLDGTSLVVDALLGTGFTGAVREREAGLIRELNAAGVTTVAVDIPSGVDGSTGEVAGEAVRADLTICAHAAKVGCVILPGAEHAGEVVTVGIGIPHEAEEFQPSVTWTDKDDLRGLVPRTTSSAHKYSAGAVLVVAGASRMTGAAVMSVEAAQRAGCGIVFLATSESGSSALDLKLTETLVNGMPEDEAGYMSLDALEDILKLAERASALVMGPAIGTGEESRSLVEGILREVEVPVVLDADGIPTLADSDALTRREAPTVITPHAGELGRLLGTSAKEVAAERLKSVRRAAAEHGCCVLLKGADTIVVEGDETAVNSTGTVSLATAGTGDVLSGVIGALLSRGSSPFDAARIGAWAHGRAAQLWLEGTGWPVESLIATDLLFHVPDAIGELL